MAERIICTLRHAAIEFGAQEIIAGRMDPPLSQRGLQQIHEMAAANVQLDHDLVIVSPLRRAAATAQRVTGLPLENILTNDLCLERDYGRLEGLLPDEREAIRPATLYVSVGGVNHSLNPPGGETLEQLRERVIAFHASILELDWAKLLVVGHQTFLQQYHGYLRGLDVYHSLVSSVSYLEYTAFQFRDEKLISWKRLYRPERIEQPW